MAFLPDAPEMPGTFSSCQRGLAIPTCITARASRMRRDSCRDRYLTVSFEVVGGGGGGVCVCVCVCVCVGGGGGGGGGVTFSAFLAHAQPANPRV